MGKALQFGLTALLSIHSAVAAPTQSAFQACTEIRDALPNKVLINGIVPVKYDYETSQYWSTTLRQVKPACIVQPSSAEDVAAAVLVLNKYSSVPFAIRSGGHDPNVGHATVQDGVLITMTNLQGAEYDAEKNVAYVKPGGEWNDVIGELEPHGVAIAGGRMGRSCSSSTITTQLTFNPRSCRCWWPSPAGRPLISQCPRGPCIRQHHWLGDRHGERFNHSCGCQHAP
jgi:hypothetical protein